MLLTPSHVKNSLHVEWLPNRTFPPQKVEHRRVETLAGRKLLGSAQARREGALLQQGSIRLAPEPAEASATSLQEELGRAVTWEELAEALVQGFARAWGIEILPGELSADEDDLASRLERERYSDPSWTLAPGRTAATIET